MSKTLPILIVIGASESRDSLAQVVSKCELRPVCCQTFAAAKALMTRQQFALVVCKDALPDGNFHAMVGEGTRRRGRQPIIVVSLARRLGLLPRRYGRRPLIAFLLPSARARSSGFWSLRFKSTDAQQKWWRSPGPKKLAKQGKS
jgi:hypothetical protein